MSYAKLRTPLLINDLNMQYYIQDRYRTNHPLDTLTPQHRSFPQAKNGAIHRRLCSHFRREVYRILREEGIDLPRYAVLNRDPDKPDGQSAAPPSPSLLSGLSGGLSRNLSQNYSLALVLSDRHP